MGVEDLKRWHWVVIGLVGGLLMAWVRVEMADSAEGARPEKSISAARFQHALELSPAYDAATKRYVPHVFDVVVSPFANDSQHYRVTGTYLKPLDTTPGFYQPMQFVFIADTPFLLVEEQQRLTPVEDADRTVLSYLEKEAKWHPWVKYRYAWWNEKRWVYVLWTAGSVVVVGGIVPVLVRLMIGAGLARPPRREEEYDLSRFGNGGSRTKAAEAKLSATEMSEEELADLKHREESLSGFLQPKREGDEQVATAEVKPLHREAESAAAGARPEEGKDYGGEFYPTVAHGKPQKRS